jgi:hypothetical protein
MSEVLYEDEYVRLEEDGGFLVMTDKVKSSGGYASLGRRTLEASDWVMLVDAVRTPEGRVAAARYIVPRPAGQGLYEELKALFLQRAQSLSQAYREGRA